MTSDSARIDRKRLRHTGLDMFKMIPSDLKIFDNISVASDQESELSEPFSDLNKNEAFIEKRKSQDLRTTDMYTYFSFSDEFRKAMESVKNESEPPADGDIFGVQAQRPTEDSQIILDLKSRVNLLLKDVISLFDRDEESKDDEDKKSNLDPGDRKPKSKDGKKKVVLDEDYYDTMSGYWRMLSAYDEFQISPIYFNAYENEKPYWLETKLIPFEEMEKTRKKCLDWLKENFDSY